MPMDFPDMKSLKEAAEVWKYRQPHESETEEEYRSLLASFVRSKDAVEAHEIRTGLGWNWWTIPGVSPQFCAEALNHPTPEGLEHLKKLRASRANKHSGNGSRSKGNGSNKPTPSRRG